NGWEPDENWHVEERQWYIDTMASDSGWSISAPYYDEQTGGYCVTISEVVYDVTSGEFLGVFGIDFFMDKLVNILGDSSSEEGYDFLVDSEGRIINHPYGAYMMTQDGETNVADLPYGEIRADGVTTKYFRDYDGAHKILIAARNTDSNFTVYVVSNTARIYGQVIVTGLIGLVAFLFCIVLVYRLLTNMIRWQEDTNRKLKAAARTAIDAGKAKSNFLAQMSHEIRTPINAVLGMNEMILRESRDENIKEYANNIQSAGRTLLSLINSILDFSKIEDGKMELVPVKYDTSSLINDLINSITDRARAKGLTLVTDIDRSLPASLLGDDVRIRQVIMNILTNAVKYTEAGSVTLTMKGTKRQEDMLVLYVSVKDTGIGIRKEDMSRLFESFERLDETRNRNIEGTGLGMSITIKLLSMMNSMLHVDSVYGEGSDFYFELEQRIVDDEPIGDFASRLKKLNANRKEEQFLIARDAKILVVDDNEMNRKVAYSLMKRNGIIADLAESGEAAIDKISEKNYDIVFLDHMMPKMDGLETLAQLKNRSLIPDGCAMIALTANATSGARERYLAAGFDDYLSKPIEIAELEKKLARWLPPEKTGWSLPEEEVVPHSAPSPPKRDPEADLKEPPQAPDRNPEAGLMEQLQELGLDTETALEFCSMDEEFYEELLRDFIEAYPVKRHELDESFASEDWKTFEVRIHAAKSTLKTLGALALSKRALSLEEAAGQQKAEELAAGYPAFIEEYLELTEHLEEMLR
ncbi:MAG: response regulator, partial [Lachnospiraceae bacterium]|nr:response regulator [Lachnospiraceae bacterium]